MVTLEKALEDKYNKVNTSFQELTTRTIDDTDQRHENYKRLKVEFEEFEK